MLPAEKQHLKRRQYERRISCFSFSDTEASSTLSVIFSPSAWYYHTSWYLRPCTCLIFSPCPRHCELLHSPCKPLQCLQTLLTTAISFLLQRDPLTPPSDTAQEHPESYQTTLPTLLIPNKMATPPSRPQLPLARCAHAYWQPSASLPRGVGGGTRQSECSAAGPEWPFTAQEVVCCGTALLYAGGHSMVLILRWRERHAQCGCWVCPPPPPPPIHLHTRKRSLYTETWTHKFKEAK